MYAAYIYIPAAYPIYQDVELVCCVDLLQFVLVSQHFRGIAAGHSLHCHWQGLGEALSRLNAMELKSSHR